MNVRLTSFSLRTLLVRAAFVVVPLVIVLFLMLGLANAVMERGLSIAFGAADKRYGNAWYEWNGDISTTDVVIASDAEADDAAAVSFDYVRIQTPGWAWVARHIFDRKLDPSGMQAAQLSFSGIRSGLGSEPTLGQLGPFGAISASPFEAEGCMQDSLWRREDLDRMGLSLGETRLQYTYSIAGTQLVSRIELETPGASRVVLERTGDAVAGADVFTTANQAGALRSERWEIRDQGFVSARNRFCTRKDEIDLRRFIERHVESVERLLATAGFAPDADTRIAYRRFVRDGGTLVFDASYAEPLPHAARNAPGQPGALLSRMAARIEHNARGNPVDWRRFAPRALPVAESGETTYATLSRERTAAMRGETLAAVVSEVPIEAPDASVGAGAASVDAVPVPMSSTPVASIVEYPAPNADPAAMTPASQTKTAAPSDSGATSAVADTAPTAPPAPAASDAPAPAALASQAATVSAPAVKSAPLKPKATIATLTPAPAPTQRTRIEWDALQNYEGRLVRIWTIHNPPRTVEILSGNANSLRVSARLGGGTAQYTIQREGFIRATLVR